MRVIRIVTFIFNAGGFSAVDNVNKIFIDAKYAANLFK
ncbi:MAG: hypothetical protein Ta2E_10420 [Mycoplasmoidaceae bacterium]|nr:MAG: hypothetical protein Ta2E_10420 [Mycoplasmoidaceae bacterium]